jgi:hypothetical protein
MPESHRIHFPEHFSASMSDHNEAAWVLQPQGGIVVREAPVPLPGPNEIIIKASLRNQAHRCIC